MIRAQPFGDVSTSNRNGAPSRFGCAVNGRPTKKSNTLIRPASSSPQNVPGLLIALTYRDRSWNVEVKTSDDGFCASKAVRLAGAW